MPLPLPLQSLATHEFSQLLDVLPQVAQWPEPLQQQTRDVMGLSPFIAETLKRGPEWALSLPQRLPFDAAKPVVYRERLSEKLLGCESEAQAMATLRQFRQEEMTLIAWRDFHQLWHIEDSLHHLSELAEAIIFEAYHWLYQMCCREWGTPMSPDGLPQSMLIIGMGKLGGGELNFSSDIDLIFTYPENGETQGTRRAIANAQFFTRLGQRLIKLLDQPTVDGFCYRVDMRLRPFGDSGPLVMSYAALEDYYQEQGRDWERYAMVKARVMGREMYAHYQELRQMLRPFVFRRYIDFSAIQSLRRMKTMIRSEVRRRGLHDNIKLGAGGIREIEFIVQSFQLIRGGREPDLRERGLLPALAGIKRLELLPASDISQLENAYVFLRRLENLIQAIDDKQTQTLPQEANHQLRLAYACGFTDWQALVGQLQQHMHNVHQIFNQVIGEEEEQASPCVAACYQELWQLTDDAQMAKQILHEELSVPSDVNLHQQLVSFKAELDKKTIGPRGREVLHHLMPKVLQAIFAHPGAQFGFARVLSLLNHIVTRTTYLELLDEHPAALTQLVNLCTASPMVSEKLSRYPILLDELIDPEQLYHPIDVSDYHCQLQDFMARIPEDDMEQQMEGLRQFKQIAILRIAAADITGVLPVMKVSDHLTSLAEAIIACVVKQAWKQVTEKFGQPTHLSQREGLGFAVLGYGKVGGWELGYNSDLDLVFLHDCPDNVVTDGAKEIDGKQFYLRLAQRITHLFSTRTPTGILYDVDTRLRPSGTAGLLVSPLTSFEEYQKENAWTWEHQALVRARMVYADEALAQGFTRVRQAILTMERDEPDLKQTVVEMRNKMRQHLAGKKANRFMLKQDAGGITDIEFLAQYLVLRYSHAKPALTRWSDNVRIFETLAEQGILSVAQAESLIHAYTTLRNQIHRRNLLNLSTDVDPSRFVAERDQVIDLWNTWLG
ncbi:bifunctional [glutamate--ammonia ligase]-adenylyl-L-tyrosine phosphorylase/[glutamate--ammonia-ligase] adenylyltransferase [Vibrio zhugei]|uniref:Bifunctional glutamine synthetase adenylyltransferase/adenylyl-removing enzyme n=1 Tax=Vibrio zhugei TaxID=2479546 RepID=A0ABV7CD00_9VIBR|nr:bifunctional [glutamate--ammonia ligase]-adenylyl-L-tyrosine phosphorylase/[glutamate--ammonia-ligase] adenylyltransferase [Vibrio zhugei]